MSLKQAAKTVRPSALERFFAAAASGMKSSVLNGSERTDGCFTAGFFQTQHTSFSMRCGAVAAQRLVRWPHRGWCGGRTAVGAVAAQRMVRWTHSGWCGGRTAVGAVAEQRLVRWPHNGWCGGNGTRKNTPACAHERQNNRTATGLRLPFQAVQTSWIWTSRFLTVRD